MANKIKIGYLSKFNPLDKFCSSGTNYKIYEQLNNQYEIKWIPIKNSNKLIVLKIIQKIYNKLFKKKINIEYIKYGSKFKYKKINKNELKDCDLIIAFFCSSYISQFKFDKPLVYLTDATFPAMVNYYSSFSNLSNFNIRQGAEIEKKAMIISDLVILSSDWAKKSAVNDLKIEENKIKIIEFGANIDDKDIINESDKEKNKYLSILFLGVDWERKGGQIAVDAVKYLNENGIKSKLNIVGIKNLKSEIKNIPFINDHGYLNKNVKEEYDKIIEILKKSDLLLLPTKAEAAGIAFAEASAFGIPIFTYDTGGIANYVINGINGYRLNIKSKGEDFGKKIKECIDKNKIKELSDGGRKIYIEKLNWSNWCKRVSEELTIYMK